MQQYVLQYVQVALRQKWPSFFFFFGRTKFTHAQYINTMYELDSARQKFDVSIGTAFLSDNAIKASRTCGRNAAAVSDFEFLSNLIR